MYKTKNMTTNEAINDWLKQYSGHSFYKHRESILRFLKFLGKTADEALEEYKQCEDKDQWAKDMGRTVVEYLNHLLSSGLAMNTARTHTINIRAFFRDKARALKVRRGAIPGPTVPLDEHKFKQSELQKCFYYACAFDKALLSLGASIGFATKDFLALKRSMMEDLVNYAVENNEDFPYFDYNRGKTGIQGRAFLMPEAVKTLKNYFDTTPSNPKDKLFDLSPDALNDHLKKVVKTAGIRTKGKVKWHLLRKFHFTALLKAMDLIHAKIIEGRRVGPELLTYLIHREEDLRDNFVEAYPYLRLVEDGDRLSKTEKQTEMLARALAKALREQKDYPSILDDIEVLRMFLES